MPAQLQKVGGAGRVAQTGRVRRADNDAAVGGIRRKAEAVADAGGGVYQDIVKLLTRVVQQHRKGRRRDRTVARAAGRGQEKQLVQLRVRRGVHEGEIAL